jgi:hypothetical protein
MKFIDRLAIWDLKREIKSFESKIRLIKAIIKEKESKS